MNSTHRNVVPNVHRFGVNYFENSQIASHPEGNHELEYYEENT
jgi:hypothetical protein